MSSLLIINITEDGGLEYISSPEASFLDGLGEAEKRRASHVEPDVLELRLVFHLLRRLFGEDGRVAAWTRRWNLVWRVNMKPSGGPVLPGRWLVRQHALEAEVAWLKERMF